MTELRSGLPAEVAELKADVRGDMATLLPRLFAANLAAMIGLAGLVLAASRLG